MTKAKKAAATVRQREGKAAKKIPLNAKTGRIVSAQQAAANPDTTVNVTVAKPKGKAKKFTIPKSLAAAADLYYETRTRRLAMEKDAEEVKKQEAALREHLIDNLPKSQAGGIAGKLARVEITKRNVPKLADERKFFAFAHRKGNEDLVKESLVVSAVQARWEAGKSVPGVEPFTIVGLSLSKLK